MVDFVYMCVTVCRERKEMAVRNMGGKQFVIFEKKNKWFSRMFVDEPLNRYTLSAQTPFLVIKQTYYSSIQIIKYISYNKQG